MKEDCEKRSVNKVAKGSLSESQGTTPSNFASCSPRIKLKKKPNKPSRIPLDFEETLADLMTIKLVENDDLKKSPK